MLNHPYVVIVMNVLYVVVCTIFFVLLIGLNYEQYGWLQTMNKSKLALWIIAVLILVYFSTFPDYLTRLGLLMLYSVATLCLMQYPLTRTKKVTQVPPVQTKHD